MDAAFRNVPPFSLESLPAFRFPCNNCKGESELNVKRSEKEGKITLKNARRSNC